MWRKTAGATLLELAVAVSVLSILAYLLLDRMRYYQEWAEKANMEYTAASLKSALLVEFSILMVEGRMREGSTLLQQNPMDWLVPKPVNYIGEFNGAAPDTLPRGNWYYDRSAREVVYRVRLGRHFKPDSRGRQEVRYRVMAIYDESPKNGGLGYSLMPPSGVRLTPIEPLRWF